MSALGKLWTLPNTLVGLAAGGAAVALGARAGAGRNAVEFHDSRIVRWLGQGAITLGNTIHYAPGMRPEREVPRYDGAGRVSLGEHERAHTHQFERWGPLFIPLYVIAGVLSSREGLGRAANPFERSADDRAQAGAAPGGLRDAP